MAEKTSKIIKYPGVHRAFAGISLLVFLVTVLAGIQAEARFITITFRALIAMVAVALIGRVVMRLIASYEEVHGDKT